MGTIDKSLIYRKRKGIDDVKKYTKTINPNTSGQSIQKGYFKTAIEGWRVDGYSVLDKFAWDQVAKISKIITSGFNRYSSFRISAYKEGLTWHELKNCTIYDVTGAGFKVAINISDDYSGILYLGTSKYSMLKEYIGIFSVDKYIFTVTGLPDETMVYFYIKNTSPGEGARSGIYTHYHVGGFIPSIIDIGAIPGVTSYRLYDYTTVDKSNPANGNGKITSVKILISYESINVKVATFYMVDSTHLSTRDTEIIPGSVPGGSVQTYDVDLNVQIGDFIGAYISNTYYGSLTGTGMWFIQSNKIPCVNQAFTFSTNIILKSICGTGETTG